MYYKVIAWDQKSRVKFVRYSLEFVITVIVIIIIIVRLHIIIILVHDELKMWLQLRSDMRFHRAVAFSKK